MRPSGACGVEPPVGGQGPPAGCGGRGRSRQLGHRGAGAGQGRPPGQGSPPRARVGGTEAPRPRPRGAALGGGHNKYVCSREARLGAVRAGRAGKKRPLVPRTLGRLFVLTQRLPRGRKGQTPLGPRRKRPVPRAPLLAPSWEPVCPPRLRAWARGRRVPCGIERQEGGVRGPGPGSSLAWAASRCGRALGPPRRLGARGRRARAAERTGCGRPAGHLLEGHAGPSPPRHPRGAQVRASCQGCSPRPQASRRAWRGGLVPARPARPRAQVSVLRWGRSSPRPQSSGVWPWGLVPLTHGPLLVPPLRGRKLCGAGAMLGTGPAPAGLPLPPTLDDQGGRGRGRLRAGAGTDLPQVQLNGRPGGDIRERLPQ